MSAPRLLAVCGAPGAGKSAVAEILAECCHGVIIDDGLPLRLACMEAYGLSWQDVSSQEGKAREIEVNGKLFTVRVLLGEMGRYLERLHGEHIMPWMAMRRALREHASAPALIFPSCRMGQGHAYRNAGGRVIEVRRSGFEAVNFFDCYEQSAVSDILDNDGTLDDLHDRTVALFRSLT